MVAAPGENMRVNGDRLWDSLMEMAKIGPGIAGGNNRQTLTDSDAEGRSLFRTWCEDAGMTLGVDKMGTMFATRPGTDPDALPVYIGSHLDTQPTGGKYDGVLGVLGALEVVRTMNDLECAKHAEYAVILTAGRLRVEVRADINRQRVRIGAWPGREHRAHLVDA